MVELKYIAGAGALTTIAVLFMIFNAAGGSLTSDGDKYCDTECTSLIYLKGLKYDITVIDFYKLSPKFSPQPSNWTFYILENGEFIEHTQFANYTFRANTDYTFKLVGQKPKGTNIKWALDLGQFNLDPWWNSSDVSVNITPAYPLASSTLNCSANISNFVTDTFNATWTWYINGTRNTTWDNTQQWNTSLIFTNTTIAMSNAYLHSQFSCCTNLSNSTFSTGFICSQNVTIQNYNYSLPVNQTNISFYCFQPFMNLSEPQGQTKFIPIINVSTRSAAQNFSNITLWSNATLPNITIYAADYPNVTNNSIIVNTTPQIVIKSLYGTNYPNLSESSKGIWMYAFCNNVSDNVSYSLNFTLGGGE